VGLNNRADVLKVVKMPPGGGAAVDLFELEPSLEGLTLASDGQDGLFVFNPGGGQFGEAPSRAVGRKGLQHWTPAAGLVSIASEVPFIIPGAIDDVAQPGLAVDARGRVYGVTGDGVVRVDPQTGEQTPIAGPGGQVFTGSGIDDSLSEPCSPVFDASGALLLADEGHGQLKRIPADKL
jgi:hypothetical protein